MPVCMKALDMCLYLCSPALLNTTKMQVTFSEGFQLSSAAPKFSSWQHPPSHKFLKQWQWVYFHFHTQPFPELAVRGLTLPRDTVSQQNSSVQRSWISAANPGWAWLWKMFIYKKLSSFSRRRNNWADASVQQNFFFKSTCDLQKWQHLPIRDYIIIWSLRKR